MITPEGVDQRLRTDFIYFLKHAPLVIKNKMGELINLTLNRAQLYIHSRLEEQLRLKGWVRALILKGRQQGCSTYIEARDYHKASRQKGKSVFVLAHDTETTSKLFSMVKQFQEFIKPQLRAEEGASNRNQLVFSKLTSNYAVGTAGNEHTGRGGTAQYFHGSEAAYWEKADAIQDGALESIALVPGTEIVLESTANGPKGLFYRKCMNAIKGIGDYILIFIPWFWQEEYERDVPRDPQFTKEEEEYIRMHLAEYPRAKAERKIIWRRFKEIDLCTAHNIESGKAKFRQIYPATPIEAFLSSGVGLVQASAIMLARKAFHIVDPTAPFIIGVDPAGDSDNSDRTILAYRRGRHFEKFDKHTYMRPMKLAGIIARIIDAQHPDKVFIDMAEGRGTVDRLHEMGYGRIVQGVWFSEGALEPGYANKRSEIIIAVAGWVNAEGVRIPDDDEVHADLACMPLDEEDSKGIKSMPSKRQIKKALGGRSPDIYDALALTFAYPVRRQFGGAAPFRKATEGEMAARGNRGPLSTRSRMRRGR